MTKPLARIVSFSGGKDSTATALLALEAGGDVRLVFADTGNEHELTLEYVREYAPAALGIEVVELRADFSRQIAGKRAFVESKWPEHGISEDFIRRTLEILHPTGVPFLDLCLWKGRFPSRMAQFCTQELKRYPLEAYMLERQGEGLKLESWQGVRRDESRNRAGVLDREETPEGWTIVRPIASWTAAEVVAYVLKSGVKLNPLYSLGMGRVGCMPCINVRKGELAEIASRFPGHIDRIREWERLVSEAAKRKWTTFFSNSLIEVPTGRLIDGGLDEDGEPRGAIPEVRMETNEEIFARLNIDSRVQWARTSRGGRQIDLIPLSEEPGGCSSLYGLCE